MIWTLNIQLAFGRYAEEDWGCELEIDAESRLADLHEAIRDAVGFDDDHLCEFFIARNPRSRDKERFDDENGGLFTATVESLFPLEKGRSLFYLFDYGDSWLFKISKSRKAPHPAAENTGYPRLVKETGRKPEQYPDMEEDW